MPDKGIIELIKLFRGTWHDLIRGKGAKLIELFKLNRSIFFKSNQFDRIDGQIEHTEKRKKIKNLESFIFSNTDVA